MINRAMHMVGSYPAGTTADAMNEMLELGGPYLATLPDGETGEPRNWMTSVMGGLGPPPDREVRREGAFAGYDRLLNFRVRLGHVLRGDSLHFGYPQTLSPPRPVFD